MFLIESIFDSIDDTIQGHVVYFFVMRYHVIIELWCCTYSQAFLDSSWHSFLSWQSQRVYIEYGCFIFDIFRKEIKFLITSHFFSVLTVLFVIFCASAAHRFSACNEVLRLSLCLRRWMPSLNPKETIKCLHLSLYTIDPSFCFPVFILYQTPVPELFQLFVILADAG